MWQNAGIKQTPNPTAHGGTMADSPMPTHATAQGAADPAVSDRRRASDTLVCQDCKTPRPASKDGRCGTCGSNRFYGEAPPTP